MSTNPKCGAKTKSGGTCGHPAGLRTDHSGEGRCYLHGGNSRIKHGRYSQIKGHLGDKIAKHMDNPNPLDLAPELATLNALLEIWLSKNEDENMAAQAMSGAIPLVDGIRKTVDTIHKMQTRELLTSREMEMGIQELLRIITEEVKDPDVIQKIANRFTSAFQIRTENRDGAIKQLEG